MSVKFDFDVRATPEENIELFLQHLEKSEPHQTAVLRQVMKELLPLPDPGPARNTKRSAANARVIELLASPDFKGD